LELSKSSRVIFGSSWIAFYHPSIETGKLRRVSFWFGMRWFGLFGVLGMINFFPIQNQCQVRFLIG
jgi:hypothetical protein